jgi:hypothetical protein
MTWNTSPVRCALVWLAAVLAVSLTACQSKTPETRHYAGRVSSTEIFIGLASNETDVLAYLCDGTESSATIGEWFRGALTNGSFDLTSTAQSRLTGQLSDREATGTWTRADGSSLDYSAPLAISPAGLYRLEETVNNETAVTGWVKLENGELRGATSIGGGLRPGPPPPPGPPGGNLSSWPFRLYYFVYP